MILSDATIRSCRPSDVAEVASLVTAILQKELPEDESAYSREDLQQLVETYAAPNSTFLVAETGDHIVGTCGVKGEDARTAILRRLFVDPEHRRRGIASALLREALSFCRKRGFREVVIRTSGRMEAATRLCRALGFQEDGRWDLKGMDLLRLRLKL